VLARIRPDGLSVALVATVIAASFLPAEGRFAGFLSDATKVLVGLVFFLQGARLLPSTVVAGLAQWRLHLTSLAFTFVLFPLVGLSLAVLVPHALTPELFSGFILLSVLPTTLQSSIAFTSIAGGNVPAAVCSASLSNIVCLLFCSVLFWVILLELGFF
jgi:sodium/bile acid cotransporter 7